MAQISEEIIEGVAVLRVSGSLMQESLSAVETRFNALAGEKGVRVVADIGQVNALSTPAITLMLRTARAVEQGGGRMVFANPTPASARTFAVCRLDAVLDFASDVAAAVKIARTREPGGRPIIRIKVL
jgi:anti-anti-sigma factor